MSTIPRTTRIAICHPGIFSTYSNVFKIFITSPSTPSVSTPYSNKSTSPKTLLLPSESLFHRYQVQMLRDFHYHDFYRKNNTFARTLFLQELVSFSISSCAQIHFSIFFCRAISGFWSYHSFSCISVKPTSYQKE